MKKGNFLDMFIASLIVYGVYFILGINYSLLKVSGLIAYMLVTDLAIVLIANRNATKDSKQKLRTRDYFKIWAALTFSVYLPAYAIYGVIGITTQTMFLMVFIYISALLFASSLLRSGVKVDTKHVLFFGQRRKSKKP